MFIGGEMWSRARTTYAVPDGEIGHDRLRDVVEFRSNVQEAWGEARYVS
jgi:hypothetical protein